MYLGKAKPKNIPRIRVVKQKFEEPIFPFNFIVVSAVFGFKLFLFSEIFLVIGMVASFLFV